MADNNEEFLTGSLDDYLLAVADSLHQAQLKLGLMRIPAQPGQPSITYQLPRLDFELKMVIGISQKSTQVGGAPGGLTLSARPISAQEANTDSMVTEAASLIKGSFVLVPADGGKPPSVIRIDLQSIESGLNITVSVQSVTGESLSGVEVQFNIDKDKSRKLNLNKYDLKPGTYLTVPKGTTNADGKVSSGLIVPEGEVAGAYIVIIIDVSGETRTIVFQVSKVEQD